MDYVTVLLNINYWAVIAAAVGSMLVGAVWYHEKVFGSEWMKAAGLKKKDVEKQKMGSLMGTAFVMTLITAVFLAVIIEMVGVSGVVDSGLFGAMIGAFIVGFSFGVNYLYEMRPHELFYTNAGYNIFSFAVMAAIIGAWQ